MPKVRKNLPEAIAVAAAALGEAGGLAREDE